MENTQALQAHRRNNRLFALLVMAIALLTYLSTVSPTVAFWDCGEYIGASHSLGIPHPPGNPLYVLLGRFFSMMLGFIREVAFRINLISVIAGGITAMLIYLIVVRASVSWLGVPDTTWKKVTVYLGGIVGGLFCAFGDTFWFSAVEASVYIPAMMVVALGTWLVLVWSQSTDPKRDRLLLFVAYLTFLGIGIHMFSMVAMAPLFLFIVIHDEQKRKNWQLWVTGILLASVIYNVSWFLWIGPITVVTTLVMSLMGGPAARQWRFCFWLSLFALLGYSVHLYIPIRSALRPMIDENHPANWDAFMQFLERKQYGSENMLARMFHRRGDLRTQFGIDGHMGFGGFHLTQFFKFSSLDTQRSLFADGWGQGMFKLIVYLIPTFFMIYGMRSLWEKNRKVAVLLIVLVVATTIGLVLFMNFADGTQAERRDYLMWVRHGKQGPMPTVHREVRIRDYFFTPGFMFLSMWMGVSATCLLHFLFTSSKQILRTGVAPALVVLFAISPALPFAQNYRENNRSNDWVPYDYAYNLLMSCEKGGILFTNGDNDTFPLWFLQEAAGIRRDVRIVNLSLLNTKWYIKQLKLIEPKVAISYSDEEIDRDVNHQLNPFKKDTPWRLPNAGINVMVPGREKKRALRVQDIMVLNIVDSNRWRKPIYFAVTVSNDNKMGLNPYLRMEGLVYRILPEKIPPRKRIDIERTLYMLDNVYRFRSLGDGSATLNETTHKLLSNYAAGFIQVALSLRDPLNKMKSEIQMLETGAVDSLDTADVDVADLLADKRSAYQDTLNIVVEKLDQCVALMPWDWRPRTLRHQVLIEHGRGEVAERRARQALEIEPHNAEYKKMLVQALEEQGKRREANTVLKDVLTMDKDPWFAYLTLARNYQEMGELDSALGVMRQFQQSHPGDQRAAAMIARIEQAKRNAAAIDTQAASTIDSSAESGSIGNTSKAPPLGPVMSKGGS